MRNLIKCIRNLQAAEEEAQSVDVKQLLIEVGTNTLLFLLIFGMAGTVDIRNLRRQLRNRYAILTGIAMQFIIMPFLGFIAVLSLKNQGLTTSMGITLLIVTASPGGSYSNWWCSLFNADLALSVAMTALSTILSIALLPANLMLYAHAAYGFDSDSNVLKSVDFVALFISLAIVIGAILSGLYASYKMHSRRFQKVSNAIGSLSGIALIAVSALFSTSTGGDSVKPWEQSWSFYVGVAMPCVAGLLVANIVAKFARLEKPEIVTLSVECCYQNVGIAASAVLAMFDDPEDVASAMAVPLLYGLLEAVVLGGYCLVAWKLGWTKAPSDEKICIVLAKTYEIGDDDEAAALQDCHENEVEIDDGSKTESLARTAQTSSTGGSEKPDSPSRIESNDEFSLPSPSKLEVVEEGVRLRNNSDADVSYDAESNRTGLVSFDSWKSSDRWSFLPFRRNRTADNSNPLPYQLPVRNANSEELSWQPRSESDSAAARGRGYTAEISDDLSMDDNEC
mmetsp:Transcript_2940/g.4496  ORF Transcript_2940/g.4496 Transcript_2940/m.4496 type:complete len:508 (-) Transcript_2940:66-1589(-)